MRAHLRTACALILAAGLAPAPAAAAVITIVNLDGPGEGFNDPSPATPVGGNPGTTVGAQRLFVFQHAASIWGGFLPSTVEIRVRARFDPMECSAQSGVLGGASPVAVVRDFPGAAFAGTWYHVALANKLAGYDLSTTSDDISTTFNSSIGGASCLPAGWYYGIDGNEGAKIELLPVVLHELGHGLGFSTTTDGSNGTQFFNYPHVYDRFLLDTSTGLHWNEMNNPQRKASATNCLKVVWSGASATGQAPNHLGPKPSLRVNTPPAIAGSYDVGLATFGPALTQSGITGDLVLVDDGAGASSTDGCEPILNPVSGKVALIDRGTCAFTLKVKNAQNAGAAAVVIADNVADCPPPALGGTDATIVIPAVRVTLDDGNTLKSQLGAGVNVTLFLDPTQRAGADASDRVRIYTPSSFVGGSSVSHWDVSAEPSLLMEPAITPGISADVDLTLGQFADIGWFQGALAADGPAPSGPGLGANFPNPFAPETHIRFSLDRAADIELGIYDLGGRLVRRLVEGPLSAGTHLARWDATGDDGRRVASGVYLYRLKTPAGSETRRLVVVR